MVLEEDVKIQISKNIKYLLKSEKKTRRSVCADLGFKYTTFCDWVQGNTTPNYRALEQLGDYFGVEPWGFYGDIEEERRKKAKVLLKYASLLKHDKVSDSEAQAQSIKNPVVVIMDEDSVDKIDLDKSKYSVLGNIPEDKFPEMIDKITNIIETQ